MGSCELDSIPNVRRKRNDFCAGGATSRSLFFQKYAFVARYFFGGILGLGLATMRCGTEMNRTTSLF